MEFMDILNNDNHPRDHESREPSISHEGSQAFLFQDLLGDYNQNENVNVNANIKAKEKERSLSKSNPSNLNGNSNPNISNDPIQAIFDDIFDDPLEESERASTIISIFTDDEEDDLESTQEGWDPNNTTFKMPQDNHTHSHNNEDIDDPFAAIMKDLDEKAQELEQKKSVKPNKKKKGKSKGKKKKSKKPKSKPAAAEPMIDPIMKPNPNPNPKVNPNSGAQSISPMSPKPSVTTIQIGGDINATVIPDEIQYALDEWENNKMGQRKGIRTLLSTLHQVLPECAMEKWKVVKMSGLLNDGAVRKHYLKGVRVVHPDKCIQRKDDKVTQMICNQIFQALEQSYASGSKK
mmetsp:Transcript_41473/g.36679  ORF Transcript_41473/g.36679 Transcript_41473/m.36679 type:complete len:348 (-) Transcript_41473:90-1133(-)